MHNQKWRNPMDPILSRADDRQRTAQKILDALQLLERWRQFGEPVLVGSAAYGLLVSPDIDIEIYCEEPRIEDGFEVLRACALLPGVTRARFARYPDGPEQSLYWQLRCLGDDGQEWKIDMFSLARDHRGPTGAQLTGPLQQVLTEETRRAILALKERVQRAGEHDFRSIDIYRAVLEGGARSLEDLKAWLERNPSEGRASWRPDPAAQAAPAQAPTGPGPEAEVSLREVTAETVRQICRLSDTLSEAQKRMVAPNAVSIAQAHYQKHAWFRAVYAGDTPVGFIMTYEGPDEDAPEKMEYFLWRFMIAGPHQGMGYGQRAIELLVERLKAQGALVLGTSCGQGEGSPEGFYRSLGFERDGEMHGDEVGLRLELAKFNQGN
jgi:diamine N-acetyltransferase